MLMLVLCLNTWSLKYWVPLHDVAQCEQICWACWKYNDYQSHLLNKKQAVNGPSRCRSQSPKYPWGPLFSKLWLFGQKIGMVAFFQVKNCLIFKKWSKLENLIKGLSGMLYTVWTSPSFRHLWYVFAEKFFVPKCFVFFVFLDFNLGPWMNGYPENFDHKYFEHVFVFEWKKNKPM